MKINKRKNGFYWIKLYEDSEWIVGRWHESYWVLPGISSPNLDESIYDVFGDTPINHPLEMNHIELTDEEMNVVRSGLIRSESMFRINASDMEDPYKSFDLIERADETNKLIKKFEKI